MTNYQPEIAGHAGPKYLAIAAAISDDIAAGRLPPDSRLPPQRDLAFRLGVTVGTVSRAYAEVTRQGLVHGEVGRGTYVLGARRPAAAEPLPSGQDDGFIDMTRNSPTQGPHGAALAATFAELADEAHCAGLLDYGMVTGLPAHREAGTQWFARVGLEVPAARVMVSGGAQMGLALTVMALTRPGDPVLVEALAYPELLNTIRVQGRRPVPVALDEHGMMASALDAACRASGARLAVAVPTLHNPTAALMPEERRRELAAVVRRHDLVLLEDDVYGYLPLERPAPIAEACPEHVIYLTSASKSLAPGLRLSWLAAPERLLPALSEAQRVVQICPPLLNAEVARCWFADGSAEALLRWLRQETAARQALAAELLAGFPLHAHPASFHVYLPLPAPWRADDFVSAAREKQVGLLPASAFAAELPAREAVRLSLSQPQTRAALSRGLTAVRDLLLSAGAGRDAII
ncbi:MAG TPA: PLP-dependent aminotransferase family protein [Alphaproteobacteria bacterium]|nr:PLP-dependent aminotransferase family protein [Alphaproteobacteria bacterium]